MMNNARKPGGSASPTLTDRQFMTAAVIGTVGLSFFALLFLYDLAVAGNEGPVLRWVASEVLNCLAAIVLLSPWSVIYARSLRRS